MFSTSSTLTHDYLSTKGGIILNNSESIVNAGTADNKEKNTERVTKNTFESKIKKLEKKIAVIDEKIATLEAQKKQCNTDIAHLRDDEILFLVKKSKMTMQEISESLELGTYIQQSGLSNSDVRELIGDDSVKSSLDLGLTQGGFNDV